MYLLIWSTVSFVLIVNYQFYKRNCSCIKFYHSFYYPKNITHTDFNTLLYFLMYRLGRFFDRLLQKPGSGPWKTWTLIIISPLPPFLWLPNSTGKTWILKNMDPEKHEIKMGLKNMSNFRELCFIKTISKLIFSG